MTAEVDVLLPMHDAERWIDESLDSVLAQDVDLRVLVLDDASTDGGPQRVLERDDDRVELVRLPRGGTVRTLNAGLELATAPYVGRMDADDVSLPGRLAAQLAVLRTAADVVVVGCAYESVDVQGRRLSVIAPPVDDAGIRRRMHLQTPYAGGSLVIRRAALERTGPFDPACASAEDYDIVCRLSRTGQLASVADVLYQWRVHPHNTSSAVKVDEHRVMRELRDQVWEHEQLRPLPPRELRAALDAALSAGPAGREVADQLVRSELLLAAALRGRGRRAEAVRVLGSVAALPPRHLVGVLADLPTRLREVRRHRAR